MHTSFFQLNEADEIESFFAQATGSDSQYIQFSDGPTALNYRQDDLSGVRLLWAENNAKARYLDTTRGETFHMGFVISGAMYCSARGIEASDSHVMVWVPGQEMENMHTGPIKTCEISVDMDVARDMGWVPSGEPMQEIDPLQAQRLRHVCLSAIMSSSEPATSNGVADLKDTLLTAIDHAIQPWLAYDQEKNLRGSYALVQKGSGYLQSLDPSNPFNVEQLVNHVAAPRRTVFHAFQNHFGVGPRKYFEHMRLSALRSNLKQKSPKSYSVLKGALDHGFHDSGRMAALYRRKFGEYPSQTLSD